MPSRSTVLAALLCISAFGSAATSKTIDPAEARSRVAASQQDAEQIYEKVPRLREVDNAIRQDCAAKNDGQAADSSFCRCASAVTMRLWLSGIDPKMVPRLQAFANDPNASAKSFIAYEGPELYAPLCHLANR